MVLEQDCSGYIDPLSYDIETRMGFVVSNWDNRDMRSDFESGTQVTTGACQQSWDFYGLSVQTYGYNEEKPDPTPDPEPEPNPEPQPAEFKPFIAYIEDDEEGGEIDGGWYELYVKGLDGRYLETTDDGKTIEMGHNNRAFVHDY